MNSKKFYILDCCFTFYSGMIFRLVFQITITFMKTLKLVILVTLLAIFSSCGERRTTTEKTQEQEAPGVGMAPDSANQNLDSAMKAADTTHDVH